MIVDLKKFIDDQRIKARGIGFIKTIHGMKRVFSTGGALC